MSPGDSSVSGLAVFFSNQSALLKPYNLKNMIYLSLTVVIFFSFSSLPLPRQSFSSHRYQTSIQWLHVSLHPAVKRPERAAGHVPQSSAEVKNKWNCTSTSLHSFKAWKGKILLTLAPLWHRLHGVRCCFAEKRYISAGGRTNLTDTKVLIGAITVCCSIFSTAIYPVTKPHQYTVNSTQLWPHVSVLPSSGQYLLYGGTYSVYILRVYCGIP
jgi:hypothetical protein